MQRPVSRKPRGRRASAKTREPLAEGVIPLNGHGHRDWISLSDDRIVRYARKVIAEKGIKNQYGLIKEDNGLYLVLLKRKLLGRIKFEKAKKVWASLSDDDLVTFAKRALKRRGIKGKTELDKAERGLYATLKKRNLLDMVGFDEIRRNWNSLSDAELIKHARQFMKERGISGRRELQKADSGLYGALLRRKLLDRIEFTKKQRPWKEMSDEELVAYANEFRRENGIKRRAGLAKADSGLYDVLRRRKLLDRVGFEERRRDWASMSDDALVGFSKKFLKKEKIEGRRRLSVVDTGLYIALRRRKLLDSVFEDIEQANEREEAQALFDLSMEFGGAE